MALFLGLEAQNLAKRQGGSIMYEVISIATANLPEVKKDHQGLSRGV